MRLVNLISFVSHFLSSASNATFHAGAVAFGAFGVCREMKLPTLFANLQRICASVLAGFALVTVMSSASSYAGAVLSNLGGPDGDNIGNVSGNFTLQTASTRNAFGFRPGPQAFTLGSISAVLDSSTGSPISTSFAIYSHSTDRPSSGSPIATSSSVAVSSKGLYKFVFSGVSLTSGTSYWGVIETGIGTRWYDMNLSSFQPTARNGSGFQFINYDQSNTFDTSKAWVGPGGSQYFRYGLTVAGPENNSQVPEPTSMAIFGLGALGLAYRARRKSRA